MFFINRWKFYLNSTAFSCNNTACFWHPKNSIFQKVHTVIPIHFIICNNRMAFELKKKIWVQLCFTKLYNPIEYIFIITDMTENHETSQRNLTDLGFIICSACAGRYLKIHFSVILRHTLCIIKLISIPLLQVLIFYE